MTLQEQEHMDYVAGCFGNEFQAAFSLSQREDRYQDDSGKVTALTGQGKHVVVCEVERFCRFTDAVLGYHLAIQSVHDTRVEAEAALGDPDVPHYYIASPMVAPPVMAHPVAAFDDGDDIPF